MFAEKACTKAGDVSSFSLILYELPIGEPVFQSTIPLGTLMDAVPRGIRVELPASMNETLKDIIQNGSSIDPSARYSFDEIWLRLESINFRLTPNVNPSSVFQFISWVRMKSRELAPAQLPVPELSASVNLPLTQRRKIVEDGVRYPFWAPQIGPDQFSLECEPDATAVDVAA
jgi:serine/threonine protein kinase